MLGICPRSHVKMTNLYVECDCTDFGHTVRLTLDENDGDLWFEFQMSYREPFYKRMWKAIKYVLGLESAYGHYDVTIIREDDIDPLINLLNHSKSLRKASK